MSVALLAVPLAVLVYSSVAQLVVLVDSSVVQLVALVEK
jgi:hypothetical protein